MRDVLNTEKKKRNNGGYYQHWQILHQSWCEGSNNIIKFT